MSNVNKITKTANIGVKNSNNIFPILLSHEQIPIITSKGDNAIMRPIANKINRLETKENIIVYITRNTNFKGNFKISQILSL